MNSLSEHIWYLNLKNKALKKQLDAFRTGSVYVNMRAEYENIIREKNAKIKELQKEVASTNAQIVTVRKNWSEIFDTLEAEHKKELIKKNNEILKLRERILEVERQRDAALDEIKEKKKENYLLKVELEEEKNKVKKLTIQVNKDFENSSIPSSMQGAKRKKIPNSREKTQRKRGGQAGHKGYRLERKEPTQVYVLEDPKAYADSTDYYATQDFVKRQKIVLNVNVEVIEYRAKVFRHRLTGSRVHAPFPPGYDTDVNYDGSVKAAAFLLNNGANVSIASTCRFLNEITGGSINISEATVNGLCKEFSAKTEQEKKELLNALMTSVVLNTDFTTANMDGHSRQVLVIASPSNEACMYMARMNKGHKGIKESPIENYMGTLIHDHDVTFYSYGMRHQECMQHNIRYLIGSIQNEPDRKWNQKMLDLIRRMLHYKNELAGAQPDEKKVKKLEQEYDKILMEAKEEYDYEPASDYYREGYNLYKRLEEYKDSQLLFLHDEKVPSNNSLAERQARKYKRKQKQAIVFRSDEALAYLCEAMGLLQSMRSKGINLYEQLSQIFERPVPKKSTI